MLNNLAFFKLFIARNAIYAPFLMTKHKQVDPGPLAIGELGKRFFTHTQNKNASS
jgi:hypothetical protein